MTDTAPDTAMPAEIASLVDRLRERAESYRMGGPSSEHTAALLDEAATALEAQAAELAAVKEMYAREGAKALYDLERAERAEAQLAETRKALNLIDALDPEEHIYSCSHDATRGLVIQMGQIARRALTGGRDDA